MENSLYDELALQLQAHNCSIHPSVIHGLVTGLTCGGMVIEGGWQSFLSTDELENKELPLILDALQEAVMENLEDTDLVFEPILPDGDAILKARLFSVVGWSQAFLQGFNWAMEKLEAKANDELTKYIDEVAEIAELEIDAESEVEGNEEDYFEVVEFLRICVLSIYTENVLKQAAAQPPVDSEDEPNPTIH